MLIHYLIEASELAIKEYRRDFKKVLFYFLYQIPELRLRPHSMVISSSATNVEKPKYRNLFGEFEEGHGIVF